VHQREQQSSASYEHLSAEIKKGLTVPGFQHGDSVQSENWQALLVMVSREFFLRVFSLVFPNRQASRKHFPRDLYL
jgi:hypothetical protein